MNTTTEPAKQQGHTENSYYAHLDDEMRRSDAGKRFPTVDFQLQARTSSDYCFWHDPVWRSEPDTTTLGESE